LEINVAWFW